MGKKKDITDKYFISPQSQRKLCSVKKIFHRLQFVLENDGIFDDELLVELGRYGSNGFLAMAVAVVDHSTSQQHSVVTVARTPPLTLLYEMASKIDGPAVRVDFQPPQMVVAVGIKDNVVARYTLTAHSSYHRGGVCSLVLVALHKLLQVLHRGIEEAREGSRPTVVGSQLWEVSDIFAVG